MCYWKIVLIKSSTAKLFIMCFLQTHWHCKIGVWNVSYASQNLQLLLRRHVNSFPVVFWPVHIKKMKFCECQENSHLKTNVRTLRENFLNSLVEDTKERLVIIRSMVKDKKLRVNFSQLSFKLAFLCAHWVWFANYPFKHVLQD